MSDAMKPELQDVHEQESPEAKGRREFLKTLGKAAVITPPAMTILLSTSLDSKAIAASNGQTRGRKNGQTHGRKISFLAKLLKHIFRG